MKSVTPHFFAIFLFSIYISMPSKKIKKIVGLNNFLWISFLKILPNFRGVTSFQAVFLDNEYGKHLFYFLRLCLYIINAITIKKKIIPRLNNYLWISLLQKFSNFRGVTSFQGFFLDNDSGTPNYFNFLRFSLYISVL